MTDIGSVPRIAKSGERGIVNSVHYNLSYVAQGDIRTDAPVVVLLHGFPGDATVWQKVTPAFSNFPGIAFDLLGNGQSDRPWPADTSVWGHADVINLALRSLELQHIILVGYGLGGGVAQVLATRLLPELVHGLVLIDSFAYQHSFNENWPLTDMTKRQDPEAPRHTSLADLEAALRQTIPQGAVNFLSAETLAAYVAPFQSEIGKEMLFQQISKLTPYYLNAVASDLSHIAAPTLIIWGEKDNVFAPKIGQQLQRQIPNSTLEIIPNAGHLVLNDAPERVGSSINAFLTQLS